MREEKEIRETIMEIENPLGFVGFDNEELNRIFIVENGVIVNVLNWVLGKRNDLYGDWFRKEQTRELKGRIEMPGFNEELRRELERRIKTPELIKRIKMASQKVEQVKKIVLAILDYREVFVRDIMVISKLAEILGINSDIFWEALAELEKEKRIKVVGNRNLTIVIKKL